MLCQAEKSKMVKTQSRRKVYTIMFPDALASGSCVSSDIVFHPKICSLSTLVDNKILDGILLWDT